MRGSWIGRWFLKGTLTNLRVKESRHRSRKGRRKIGKRGRVLMQATKQSMRYCRSRAWSGLSQYHLIRWLRTQQVWGKGKRSGHSSPSLRWKTQVRTCNHDLYSIATYYSNHKLIQHLCSRPAQLFSRLCSSSISLCFLPPTHQIIYSLCYAPLIIKEFSMSLLEKRKIKHIQHVPATSKKAIGHLNLAASIISSQFLDTKFRKEFACLESQEGENCFLNCNEIAKGQI